MRTIPPTPKRSRYHDWKKRQAKRIPHFQRSMAVRRVEERLISETPPMECSICKRPRVASWWKWSLCATCLSEGAMVRLEDMYERLVTDEIQKLGGPV